MVVSNRDINDDRKCRQIAGHFDDHRDVVVDCFSSCVVQYSTVLCQKLFLVMYTSIVP